MARQSNSSLKFDLNAGHWKYSSPSERRRIQELEEIEANEPSVPPSRYPLSKENLQILRLLNGEVMPSAAKNTKALGVATTENESKDTARSSSTEAFYRSKTLGEVEIHLHSDLPDNIRALVDGIFTTEISQKRESELAIVSQALNIRCLANVRSLSRQDDYIAALDAALASFGLGKVCSHQQCDWQEDLKPVVSSQSCFNASLAFPEPHPVADQAFGPRTPVDGVQELSSKTPPTTGPPRSPVKTPRSDISIGLQLKAVVSALSSQDLSRHKAGRLLPWLQKKMVPHDPSRPVKLEPMLISTPAPSAASQLVFPFAVVEAKSYSTGKQIFEAENQAAVAAACALKIQLDLDKLVARLTATDPESPSSCDLQPPPLFFSISTQGPPHEISVHWCVEEDGIRTFESQLLDSFNVLLPNQAKEFVASLDKILVWGLSTWMDSVVQRLRIVSRKLS